MISDTHKNTPEIMIQRSTVLVIITNNIHVCDTAVFLSISPRIVNYYHG
jgi:hypothetical protein